MNKTMTIFMLVSSAIANTAFAFTTLIEINLSLALIWMLSTAIVLTIFGGKMIK